MTDLRGKVIVVTGASAGIGKAIVQRLVSVGAKVVGCARNVEKLKEIATSLNAKGPGEIKVIKCDVTIEDDVINLYKYAKEKFGILHATVNSAGTFEIGNILTGKTEDWIKTYEGDIMGVAMCSREAIKMMKKCGVDNGHVVNMNSLSGHRVVNWAPLHFHTATKYGVTALTESLRQELRAEKSHIRVTAISPGMVKTNITKNAFPDPNNQPAYYSTFEALHTQDIADAVLYAMTAPPRVDVSDIRLRSVEQST